MEMAPQCRVQYLLLIRLVARHDGRWPDARQSVLVQQSRGDGLLNLAEISERILPSRQPEVEAPATAFLDRSANWRSRPEERLLFLLYSWSRVRRHKSPASPLCVRGPSCGCSSRPSRKATRFLPRFPPFRAFQPRSLDILLSHNTPLTSPQSVMLESCVLAHSDPASLRRPAPHTRTSGQ